MPLKFLVIPRLPFLEKWRMHLFVHFFIVFCSYTTLHNQRSMLSNFLVFHITGGILLRPAAFLLLIFWYCISFSSVNYSNLMSSLLLIIFSGGLSVISGVFPSRFLKCCFHSWNLGWQLLILLFLYVYYLQY